MTISASTRNRLFNKFRDQYGDETHVDAHMGSTMRTWLFGIMAMQAATVAGVIAAVRL